MNIKYDLEVDHSREEFEEVARNMRRLSELPLTRNDPHKKRTISFYSRDRDINDVTYYVEDEYHHEGQDDTSDRNRILVVRDFGMDEGKLALISFQEIDSRDSSQNNHEVYDPPKILD